ncbi:UDP-N-acetylmuramoyl-L-alanyl-D-glutamate--2,6-diaminopimelate ligase [Corynebacterium mendelii]|uniref:UDP-N-acetylmuramoyl-L-alanyl-D-glutamate--2,6-diaminopimelate ligase n=1 Tax=Corynebacterium mendelii TaxID=2765362 RepID=A0A939E089_9CORY|nr:UDP-N-acetylmuramoyl-L-alanyl-D-glutamate--2,6-diaminopimelate ligase [Corynebacterium mendelii]MBN9643097.1 UDP-N-acetylmuramoyl-L-alanyl-D-glutamate--2,6-diaminopimelate ligase [Corynebacterium mendelii]
MGSSLANLTRISGGKLIGGSHEHAEKLRVDSVGINAQSVGKLGLFAAVPGTRAHGAQFAAKSAGPAILTDPEGQKILQESGEIRPIIVVDDVRAVLGEVAADVYGHPSEKLTVIGVTGTSGKTTVAHLIEQSLLSAGYKVGMIGTNGTRINGQAVETELTTPEAPVLQELYRQMNDEGVTHVVMEVSSHALVLGRVNGTRFAVGGFTNLSQDHLDFHHTMEEYFEAKAAFFRPGSPVRAARQVICVDGDWGKKMAVVAGPSADTLSVEGAPATITVTDIADGDDGHKNFTVHLAGCKYPVSISMPGQFNITNAALALSLAVAAGVDGATAAAGMKDAVVPGRMQSIDVGQNFTAVVDYAHKPAALAAVLDTLNQQRTGRTAVVVGAGGNRDTGKRPLMGKNACQRADLVIVTDDNPRDEDPAAIRAQIIAGITEITKEKQAAAKKQKGKKTKITRVAEYREIGDRAQAIQAAVDWADEGDAIVVAGKGHETGQKIGGEIHPFDDREVLERCIRRRLSAAASDTPDGVDGPVAG